MLLEAGGTVARIAGVQGFHRARRETAHTQDAGFGYLVAAVVGALSAGERSRSGTGRSLNTLATPTLRHDAGEMIWRAIEREAGGVLHCCGAEHTDRVTLARRTPRRLGLDPERSAPGRPPPRRSRRGGAPYDTRLRATRSRWRWTLEHAGIDDLLSALRDDWRHAL